MGKILEEDFREIALSNFPHQKLTNASFLITGATGYLGSLLIRTLLYCNSFYDMNLRIIAQIRDEKKAKAILGESIEDPALSFIKIDFCNQAMINCDPVDYIIHTAAVTSSKTMIERPVETILSSLNSTKAILEYSVKSSPKSVVYISSMEMYGEIHGEKKIAEEDIGYLDPLAVRSDYPESKRLCENLCVAYHSEYGVRVKIARLAQMFGAGILPGENRVFAQFAKAVLEQKDIVLHTTGESEGNYCYTSDAIRAILLILMEGEDANAYNIVNEEMHSSIKDMARLVAENIAEGRIKIVYDIPEKNLYGYAPAVRMKLDSSKLRALGWEPAIGMVEAYQRMLIEMENK